VPGDRWKTVVAGDGRERTIDRVNIDTFVRDGYVAVRGAFDERIAGACRDMIWDSLGGQGISRADRATWTRPLVRIVCPEGEPFAAASASPALTAAYDELIGAGRWTRRAVYLCHPFIVHTATWPHRGTSPRMMAQPGVEVPGGFALDGSDSSPVARAIVEGLAPAS
jgi:hypothetical protein